MTCDHKFIDTNYCAKCGANVEAIRTRSSYPDDVVSVMRDTISAQREALASKDALIADLRAGIHSATRTIAACPSCSRQMLQGELA